MADRAIKDDVAIPAHAQLERRMDPRSVQRLGSAPDAL
jgi:hypothetical protein